MIINHIILIYCNFLIQIMSHKKLRPFIVKVSVLGYFPLLGRSLIYNKNKIGPKTDPCYTPDFTIELLKNNFQPV